MKNYFLISLLLAIAFAATPSYIFSSSDTVLTQQKKSNIKKNKSNTVPAWIKYGLVPGAVIGIGSAIACSKYVSSSPSVTAGVGFGASVIGGGLCYTLAAPKSELAELAEQVEAIRAKVDVAQAVQNNIDATVLDVQRQVAQIAHVQDQQGAQITHIDDTMQHVEQTVERIEDWYGALLRGNKTAQKKMRNGFQQASGAASTMNKNIDNVQKTFTLSTEIIGNSMQQRGNALSILSSDLADLQGTIRIRQENAKRGAYMLPLLTGSSPLHYGKHSNWHFSQSFQLYNPTGMEMREL